MSNNDMLEFEGIVESFSKGIFKVKVNDNYMPLCTLSGKIRQSEIKIIAGDRVKILITPYDTQRGRIVFRIKQ